MVWHSRYFVFLVTENVIPEAVLSTIGARVFRFLGGRLNKHWLVEKCGDQLVLRRWSAQSLESIEYELQLVSSLKTIGWPVAPLEQPEEIEGNLWSLSPALLGESNSVNGPEEQRERGRLLAEFHAVTAGIEALEQRPGWRRFEEILGDQELDRVLSTYERTRSEEVRIVRWHLDRARKRIEGLRLGERPSLPVHGDFTAWNLLYLNGQLSGVLDFELSRNDHRVADFGLAWRGKYDQVIHGYNEVSPLEQEEYAMLVPAWWSVLIEDSCRNFQLGVQDDGWTMTKMLVRSPIMGVDAEAMP